MTTEEAQEKLRAMGLCGEHSGYGLLCTLPAGHFVPPITANDHNAVRGTWETE